MVDRMGSRFVTAVGDFPRRFPFLVVLTTLFLGDLVTEGEKTTLVPAKADLTGGGGLSGNDVLQEKEDRRMIWYSHMFGELLQVRLLLGELLLQLDQLLLLPLLDSPVFKGVFPPLECVAAVIQIVSRYFQLVTPFFPTTAPSSCPRPLFCFGHSIRLALMA